MAKYRITLRLSKSGATKRQIANLTSLGLHKINQTVEVEKNPVTTGMLLKVKHLVNVEEI
jgi:large subunit ribosomal protein L30